MSKKGNFCGPYKKTSEKFKNRGSTWDQQNHFRAWPAKETDYLTEAAAKSKGRVSYQGGKDAATENVKSEAKNVEKSKKANEPK